MSSVHVLDGIIDYKVCKYNHATEAVVSRVLKLFDDLVPSEVQTKSGCESFFHTTGHTQFITAHL